VQTIEEVLDQVNQWRAKKKFRHEPMPTDLKQKISDLREQYSISEITKRLKVDAYYYFHSSKHAKARRSKARKVGAKFISADAVFKHAPTQVVAVELPQGVCLKVASGDPFLTQLMDRLLGVRA